MPELPEVETTVRGLKKTIRNLIIEDVWTDLNTEDKRKKDTVSNPKYFKTFKKEALGKKVLSIERRAKNILINLSNGKTILIHLKMTGHLLFNKKDRYVHLLLYFSNGKFLAFSDMRKFGKITLLNAKEAYDTKHLKNIGPEPLAKNFNADGLAKRMKRKPNGRVKAVLMDQATIAGIGNIYSDEILWQTGIHPEKKISKIKEKEFENIFKAMREILIESIKAGGDSMSNYINIYGKKGKFQLYHEAYRRTGKKCRKKNCNGVIKRKVVNGRSAHFCSVHQI